jgi:hypothetical protein
LWKEKGDWPHATQANMQDRGECKARSEAILIVPQDNAPWTEKLAGEKDCNAVNNMVGDEVAPGVVEG